MFFLVSNDDGYRAPGVRSLADMLTSLGEVAVVAPERNHSGASNSLTLENPLRVEEFDHQRYFVNGTPTDCVHIAITGLLKKEPDMVVSGINAGANLGDDVLYSGTVAAAMEGRFLGLPSLAVSLSGTTPLHYDTASKVMYALISKLQYSPLDNNTILNINVPDLPWAEIKGIKSTRLGQRHKSEPAITSLNPRGETIYWVGPPGGEQDAGPGTDFHAVKNGFVSVTPLLVDLTHRESVHTFSDWLDKNELADQAGLSGE